MKIPEIKISIKFDNAKMSELYGITKSSDIYELSKKVFNADTIQWVEEMILFCLNRNNKVVGFYKVSSGGTAGTLCDIKVILTIALNSCAHSLILAHNHPSGNLKPSEADIQVTKKLKDAVTFLNIVRILIIIQPINNKTMKTLKKITRTQLIEMLKNWNYGAQPASIQYVTEPKLTKEGKVKFGQVTKIANVGCMIGYKYENAVNNELEREGKEREFLAQPLWNGKGKRISTALATHIEKQSFYLTYKAQQTFRSFHFDSVLNLIPNALIKQYFPVSNPAKQQGVENAVYHREISIENIKRLKFKGCTYEIV